MRALFYVPFYYMSLADLKKKLNINEKFTKSTRQEKVFTKVKDQLPQVEDANFMGDLLQLPTHRGFSYLLVVVDLITDEFDIEPIKNKEPATVLAALKKMVKRPYINLPTASLRTDGGTEFKGVFHKYLYDNNILHKVALASRHTQLANVERLNRTLGKLFNGYMNTHEEKTGKKYTNWIEAVSVIRTELNKFRKKEPDPSREEKFPDVSKKPKFHVGDIVYRKLETPRSATGEKLHGKFREGDVRMDTVPRKIVNVVYASGAVPYRYILSGLPNVSFTGNQLKKADEEQEKFEVDRLLDKKKIKGRIHYLVKWKGYSKEDATYEPRSTLLKDAPEIVKEFEARQKQKASRKS